MSELKIFENKDFGAVRTVEENGKILFCGSDVAKALGYGQPHKAIKQHCKDEGIFHTVTDALGRNQKAKFINEGNLYRLIVNSKLPSAEKFEHWVFDEVLPSIRQTGTYMTAETIEKVLYDPDVIIGIAQQLKDLKTEIARKNQIIGELKPKANYVDIILDNKGLVTITQIAKDYGMSGAKMNTLLNEYGVQYKQSGQWLLYSKYHGMGYTHSKTISIVRTDGSPDVVMETKWTQKGRLFIYELLKDKGIYPVIEQPQIA